MKNFHVIPLIACLTGFSQAATVNAFWSVQNSKAGSDGANGMVTASTFVGATPSITREAGISTNNGGASSFVSYEGGTPWLGSGGTGTPGHSYGWNPGSTGNSMTIAFEMTDTYDLTLRADLRSAHSNGGGRSTAFTSIEYSLDGGSNYFTTGSSLAYGIAEDNNFNEYNLDLSDLSAIEDQASVLIRFGIADQPIGGGSDPNASLRIDNVQLSADYVPEPTVAILFSLGALALLRRRR